MVTAPCTGQRPTGLPGPPHSTAQTFDVVGQGTDARNSRHRACSLAPTVPAREELWCYSACGARLVTRLLLLAAEQSQQRHTGHLDHLHGSGAHTGRHGSARRCGAAAADKDSSAGPAANPATPRAPQRILPPQCTAAARCPAPCTRAHLEADAGDITHGVASPTKPGDQNLILQRGLERGRVHPLPPPLVPHTQQRLGQPSGILRPHHSRSPR